MKRNQVMQAALVLCPWPLVYRLYWRTDCTDCTAYTADPAPSSQAQWRDLLKMQESGVEAFMADSWSIRRAALAGREANGGNPMALTPVSDLSAN